MTVIDAAMGELRHGLHKLDVADHTMLWYCSDNGGLSGSIRLANTIERTFGIEHFAQLGAKELTLQ